MQPSSYSAFSATGDTAATPLYTGTLAGFAAASTNFSNSVGIWAPTRNPPETRTYQFV